MYCTEYLSNEIIHKYIILKINKYDKDECYIRRISEEAALLQSLLQLSMLIKLNERAKNKIIGIYLIFAESIGVFCQLLIKLILLNKNGEKNEKGKIHISFSNGITLVVKHLGNLAYFCEG